MRLRRTIKAKNLEPGMTTKGGTVVSVGPCDRPHGPWYEVVLSDGRRLVVLPDARFLR